MSLLLKGSRPVTIARSIKRVTRGGNLIKPTEISGFRILYQLRGPANPVILMAKQAISEGVDKIVLGIITALLYRG
ncbi:MAG TPA: hypothetical protein VIK24_17680 [Pyrinomonadaceae bacterium]